MGLRLDLSSPAAPNRQICCRRRWPRCKASRMKMIFCVDPHPFCEELSQYHVHQTFYLNSFSVALLSFQVDSPALLLLLHEA